MRIHDLDLNLIVALDALLEEQGVTRAARRLHVGQPALSSTLRRLREHFRDELLIQSGRGMALTPLARKLKQPVRSSLSKLESVLSARARFDPAKADCSVSVVASDYVVSAALGPFLRRVAQEAPGVRVSVISPDPVADDRFEQGEFELRVLPESFVDERHPRQILMRDAFCCAVWEGNTRIRQRISLRAFCDLRHVQPGFGMERTYLAEAVAGAAGQRFEVAEVLPSFALALEALVGTDYVAVVPSVMARLCAQRLPLRLARCPLELPPLVEVLQWPRHRELDPLVQWVRLRILESAEQAMRELPGAETVPA